LLKSAFYRIRMSIFRILSISVQHFCRMVYHLMTGLVSLLARSEPQQFQEYFLSWVNAIIGELELNVIAIDGKTMKLSYDRNEQQTALHIVTAWSSSHQLVLGKKKEIKNLIRRMAAECVGVSLNNSCRGDSLGDSCASCTF
ncbi:hypothetical protein QUB20_27800, partial [Microcoleus sp. B4-C2]